MAFPRSVSFPSCRASPSPPTPQTVNKIFSISHITMKCLVLLGLCLLCLISSTVADYESSVIRTPTKRRMLFRVPFMMNPDNEQLSRIFRQAFGEQKQKKLSAFFDY
ncbi:unnamed protein product [Auanema sp. JU1783]|nr:unnamed protein product [Auanema sp. JU1783]